MTLNARERIIAIAAAAVIGALALDSLVLSPLKARLDAGTSRTFARVSLERANGLMRNQLTARQKWKSIAGTTLKDGASAAESQLLNHLRDYAQGASLTLGSVKPDRSEKENGFQRITLRASANGTMEQIAHFLFALRTADIPVRVSEVQISARREGTDDLSLNIIISTIFTPPPEPTPGTPPVAMTAGDRGRM